MTVMKSVSAFDAKTHLTELLLRASKGETIQITRRGVPVAKLVPPEDGEKDARSLIIRTKIRMRISPRPK